MYSHCTRLLMSLRWCMVFTQVLLRRSVEVVVGSVSGLCCVEQRVGVETVGPLSLHGARQVIQTQRQLTLKRRRLHTIHNNINFQIIKQKYKQP